MKWIAAILSFFFMGLGYVVAVPEKRILGILWTIAAVILTYVEQVAIDRVATPQAFQFMALGVFIANTAFAIDGWREAQPRSTARM